MGGGLIPCLVAWFTIHLKKTWHAVEPRTDTQTKTAAQTLEEKKQQQTSANKSNVKVVTIQATEGNAQVFPISFVYASRAEIEVNFLALRASRNHIQARYPPLNTAIMQQDCLNWRHSMLLLQKSILLLLTDKASVEAQGTYTLQLPELQKSTQPTETTYWRNSRENFHLRTASTSQCCCFSTGREEIHG